MLILFLASFIKNLLANTAFASYYMKLSLPMFLKCFLITASIHPRASYVSYLKKDVQEDITVQMPEFNFRQKP